MQDHYYKLFKQPRTNRVNALFDEAFASKNYVFFQKIIEQYMAIYEYKLQDGIQTR